MNGYSTDLTPKIRALLITSCALVITYTAQASTASDTQLHTKVWQRVASVSLGPAWSQPGTTQTFYLQPDIEKTYTNLTSTKLLGVGELFFGLQHSVYSTLQGQFGVALAGTTSMTLNGSIWEDADPNFNNFDYSYKIQHAHIAAKAKLINNIPWIFQPYIAGSLGVAFNRASNFSIVTKLSEETPAPLFNSQTTTAFTYTVGAGLQKKLSEHWQFGVGYEFADWGNTTLAAGSGQTLNTGPSLNHVYTHELQFNLSLIG